MNDQSLATRLSIVKLLNDAHNEVNARTGKKIMSLTEHNNIYSLNPSRVRINSILRDSVIAIVVTIVVARLVRHRYVREMN